MVTMKRNSDTQLQIKYIPTTQRIHSNHRCHNHNHNHNHNHHLLHRKQNKIGNSFERESNINSSTRVIMKILHTTQNRDDRNDCCHNNMNWHQCCRNTNNSISISSNNNSNGNSRNRPSSYTTTTTPTAAWNKKGKFQHNLLHGMRIQQVSKRHNPHLTFFYASSTIAPISSILWYMLLTMFLMTISSPTSVTAVASVDERALLMEFYRSTNGDNWKDQYNWNTNNPICSWYGISCEGHSTSGTEGVSRIDLNSNNVNGKIPTSFWSLPYLSALNLRSNLLTGASFEGLQQPLSPPQSSGGGGNNPNEPPLRSPLELLVLSENHLTSIEGIGHAKSTLKNLNVNKNQLDHPLPSDLFELTNLETLYLAFNLIPGTIPTLIGRLSRLTEFYAFDNRFSGQIPTEIGLLDSCQILGLGNNFLTGTLPTEMNQMVNMRDISIHHVISHHEAGAGPDGSGPQQQQQQQPGGGNGPDGSQFQGISGPLLSFGDMPFLTLLFLDGNSLSGTIPSDFLRHNNNTDKPVSVGLTDNNITGTIPKSLERFEALSLDLVGNSITDIPSELCDKGGWMGGLVQEMKCDAILCPIGTFNIDGRATGDENPCEPCDDVRNIYWGATFCSTSSSIESTWQILYNFYTALGGERWTVRDGWQVFDTIENSGESISASLVNLQIDICNGWHGLDCEDGTLTSITLPQNDMFGTIPDSIFSIPSLKVFDLSNNNVQMSSLHAVGDAGEIRTLILSNIKLDTLEGMERLTGLEELYLDGQRYEGNIPNELFDLTNLRALHLQYGHFVGTLSTLIGKLSGLSLLNMYGNTLSGQIPTQLGRLTKLLSLDLSENKFTGTLPTELNAITHLAVLAVHQTSAALSGPLPAFESFTKLKEINLDSNNFAGQIPTNFLSGIENKQSLITISLAMNQLTGSIPEGLDQFSLLNLNLEGNKITSIPSRLCDHLDWMDGEVGRVAEANRCNAILCPPFTWNQNGKETSSSECRECTENRQFYGVTSCGVAPVSREREILDKLFSMTGGRYWTGPHDNWLRPGVPICQREGINCFDTNADEGVREIQMNGYGMRGVIPSDIWELSSARLLAFTNNAIDLSFEGIEKAKSLSTLKLSHCHLRSLLGLGNATSALTELHIAANQFNSTIPMELFDNDSLYSIFLNENHFSGRIPTAIQRMTNLRALQLYDNILSGPIPSELGLLSNLEVLNLQQNALSGAIPVEIQVHQKLRILDISKQEGKKFQGAFPPFDNSPALTSIDASHNAFSGWLPPTLLGRADHSAPITVNLASNRIEGPVPEQWASFQALDIDLSGNLLTALPETLCSNNGWNNGMVGILSTCDAILCPKGYSHPSGRQTDAAHPCEQCPFGLESAPYLGSRECIDPIILAQTELLNNFYVATNGPNWLSQTNWLSNNPICTWFGIQCNENGFIEEIDLGGNFLTSGPNEKADVSAIFTLPELKVLDLKNNHIELDFHLIPPDSKLEFLRVSGTGLRSLEGLSRASGLLDLHATNNEIVYIPEDMYDMLSLKSLFLSFNKITGSIPTEIGRMTNLNELYLFGNHITGTLPSEIGRMSSLVEFVAASNFLSGEIPSEISELPNLEQFSVANQEGLELITGPVPTFAGATKLWYFDASNNDLTGSLPENFMVNSEYKLDDVTVYLTNNEITGTIPARLQDFERLDLILVGNKIVDIPEVLCQLDGWMQGNVKEIGNCNAILCPKGTFNQYGREMPGYACLPCSHLQGIDYLGRSRCEDFTSERDTLNKLFDAAGGEFWNSSRSWKSEAPICSWGGVLCEDGDLQDTHGITSIKLESNGLSGTLPSDIWTLPSLRRVDVDNNPNLLITFEGLANAADTLEVASFSNVQMSSLDGISAATSLRELHISGNNLKGTFPEELFALSNTLEALYMAHNLFYGSLPTMLGEMTRLQAFFAFGNDFLSTIPTELGRLRDLRTLVLSENLLYGQLPNELSALPNLLVLSIYRREKSGPRLFGTLPSLDKLPQLKNVFLEGNEIRGTIPRDFLSASRSVDTVDLSYNLLTGEAPVDLISIPNLNLLLTGNDIEGFPSLFCEKRDWMNGDVATYGCDAILCPPGTANPDGRASASSGPCINCTRPAVAPFYGSISCDGPNSEREILTNLFYATGGNGWYRNDFWGTTADICDWYGIGCIEGRVVQINLRANNLIGKPGPDLFYLPDLQILWLYSNPISFSFENIGSASKLQDLRLDSTNLRSLYGIGAATSLLSFDARFAPIRGTFPEDILSLTNLRSLALGDNQLSGSLPKSFGNLRYLVHISANSNRLTGRLPAFDDLHLLNYIDLSDNQLTGPISRKFLDKIPVDSSPFVKVSNNQLSGVIPEEFDRFKEMTLYVQQNEILGLPLTLCDNDNWNDGDVGYFGCDAIVCKPGSYNTLGRSTQKGGKCQTCPSALHYGSTSCPDKDNSNGASNGSGNGAGDISRGTSPRGVYALVILCLVLLSLFYFFLKEKGTKYFRRGLRR